MSGELDQLNGLPPEQRAFLRSVAKNFPPEVSVGPLNTQLEPLRTSDAPGLVSVIASNVARFPFWDCKVACPVGINPENPKKGYIFSGKLPNGQLADYVISSLSHNTRPCERIDPLNPLLVHWATARVDDPVASLYASPLFVPPVWSNELPAIRKLVGANPLALSGSKGDPTAERSFAYFSGIVTGFLKIRSLIQSEVGAPQQGKYLDKFYQALEIYFSVDPTNAPRYNYTRDRTGNAALYRQFYDLMEPVYKLIT